MSFNTDSSQIDKTHRTVELIGALFADKEDKIFTAGLRIGLYAL